MNVVRTFRNISVRYFNPRLIKRNKIRGKRVAFYETDINFDRFAVIMADTPSLIRDESSRGFCSFER